jgi:hypothetical protein
MLPNNVELPTFAVLCSNCISRVCCRATAVEQNVEERRSLTMKVKVRDAERNLRSYFRAFVIRAVSKARTDAARWCAGRSNKYWLMTVVLPKRKAHQSERPSCQSSLSNVCPLLFCVFVCVCAC